MLCVLQVHANTWSSPFVRICYPNGGLFGGIGIIPGAIIGGIIGGIGGAFGGSYVGTWVTDKIYGQ